MITITRRQARRLRGVLRRHALGVPHRGAVPALVLHARDAELRASYRHAALAIEFVDSIALASRESIALPLDALAEFEGRDDSSVILEGLAPDRTSVRWTDRGVPQSRAYAVPPLDAIESSPERPVEWATLPPSILTALAEASETAAEDSTRYALNCLQLGGGTGAVAATDGRQLLIHGGFRLPWTDEILIRSSPLFACPGLPRDQPVEIGRTDSHVVLRVGPWTLFLEIQTEGRYPDLGRVVPDPTAAATRLTLDPEDARFLGPALDRLPGAADSHAPAVLELNGEVATGPGARIRPGPPSWSWLAPPTAAPRSDSTRTGNSCPGRCGSASRRSRSSTPSPRPSAATGTSSSAGSPSRRTRRSRRATTSHILNPSPQSARRPSKRTSQPAGGSPWIERTRPQPRRRNPPVWRP